MRETVDRRWVWSAAIGVVYCVCVWVNSICSNNSENIQKSRLDSMVDCDALGAKCGKATRLMWALFRRVSLS
jgi:hypothetical protein